MRQAQVELMTCLAPADSYWLALRMVSDRETLLEFAEQVETDPRLRASERASLRSHLRARTGPAPALIH